MKKITPMIPGYQVCEYMLILSPPEDLKSKVTEVRNEFNRQFEILTVPSKPNLMLASFTQYAMMEERIVSKLKTISMGHYPFKVELKDFGSFPSHTVYINVTSKVPIQDLVKKIRHDAQFLMKLNEDNKPYFAMEPHLTIARKLKPWQYEKSWLEYSTKHFSGRFIADGMILLKRYEGDRTWTIAKRFEFQNLPVSIKQGELF
jgi:2'-5' RNA ligase